MAVDPNGAADDCRCPTCSGVRERNPEQYIGLTWNKPVPKPQKYLSKDMTDNPYINNWPVGTRMTCQEFYSLGYKPQGGWVKDLTTDTISKVSTLDDSSATPVRNKPSTDRPPRSKSEAAILKKKLFGEIYGATLPEERYMQEMRSQLAKAFAEEFPFNLQGTRTGRIPPGEYTVQNSVQDSVILNEVTPEYLTRMFRKNKRAERTDTDMNFDDGYEGNGSYARVNGEWFYSTGNGDYTPLSERGRYHVVLANGGKFDIEADLVENFDSARTLRYKNENGDRVTLNMAHVQSVTEPKNVNAIRQTLIAKRETEAYEAQQATRKEEARARKVEQKREELSVEQDAKASSKK